MKACPGQVVSVAKIIGEASQSCDLGTQGPLGVRDPGWVLQSYVSANQNNTDEGRGRERERQRRADYESGGMRTASSFFEAL